MHDSLAFFVQCWTSGTLLRSTCALVVVPVLAWGAIRLVAPAIARSGNDPGWQAPLAAAAAAIPGALMLVLSTVALFGGLRAACLETISGRVLFAAIVLFTLVALARAIVLARRRSGEASTIVRSSLQACGRLAAIAERASVGARVIADARPFCALVGTFRSTVVVSEGALARLSDAELEAALLHERGHARRGDQIIAAALSFLVDLLPLPAMDLVAIYRHAREVAADRHALVVAKPHDLAGALLSFVKAGSAPTASAALAGTTGIHERLNLLLRAQPARPISHTRRAALTFALALILATGFAPASASLVAAAPCTMSVTPSTAH